MIGILKERRKEKYEDVYLNIIKSAFQTKIITFIEADYKIRFQYTLTERRQELSHSI